MSIAAVIPAYNAAAFLEGTLASVFAQSRRPDQVIVVDDGSTDDTAAMARRFGATVIVLPANSGGPAVPLNTGIAAATCDWIAPLDHDDRWRPDWLENAVTAADAAKVELVFGRVHARPGNTDLQATLDAIGQWFCENAENCGPECYRIIHPMAYRWLVHGLSCVVTCSNIVFTKRLGNAIEFDHHVTRCCDYRFIQQVTCGNNIAFSDTVSCDWIHSPNSLYQHGSMDKLDRDLLYVYKHFERSNLGPVEQTGCRFWSRKTANDLAYAARNRGAYGRAFRDYCDSIHYGGINRTALFGILKLPLAMLRGKQP